MNFLHIVKGSTAYTYSYFGSISNPPIISHLYCSGSETSLVNCYRHTSWYTYPPLYCGDDNVAGAVCLGICSKCIAKLIFLAYNY